LLTHLDREQHTTYRWSESYRYTCRTRRRNDLPHLGFSNQLTEQKQRYGTYSDSDRTA